MIDLATAPRRTRTAVATLTPLMLLIAVMTGCSANNTGSPTATTSAVQQIEPGDRVDVEPFVGTQLDGQTFDSRDLAGMVVVYNVWGSWCAPCRTEAPGLALVSRTNEGTGVRFVGINVRDNDAAARAFEKRFDIAYDSIDTATSSAALLAFGPALPPSAVPSTMIVDQQGRLAARVIGPIDESTLKALIDDTLSEVPGGAS